MSGTKQPKALVEYTLAELRKMHAALAPLYPPATITDPRELTERAHLLQWAGGAHQVIADIENAIQQKQTDKE